MKITAKEAREETNKAQEKFKKFENSKIGRFLRYLDELLDELPKKMELKSVYGDIKFAASLEKRETSIKIRYKETIDALIKDGYHISTDPFTFGITHEYDITW